MASILHGTRDGELPGGRGGRGEMVALQRPEYTGGIEVTGLAALEQFVRDGGTLIAFDAASELPVSIVPAAGPRCRRILLPRIDPANYGGRDKTRSLSACRRKRMHFQVEVRHGTLRSCHNSTAASAGSKAVAKYAAHDVLASGWFSGEQAVLRQGHFGGRPPRTRPRRAVWIPAAISGTTIRHVQVPVERHLPGFGTPL